MGAISAVLAVVVAVLIGVGIWILTRRALSGSRVGPLPARGASSVESRESAPLFRSEALASLTALAVAWCTAILMFLAGAWWPQGFGLAYALAVSISAILGLIAYNLYPRASWDSAPTARTHAELVPRGPVSFARQWVFTLPLVTAMALILGLVLTGLYSSTDESGLHRVHQRRGLSGWGIEDGQVVDVQYGLSTSGPFPGWYYGVPIMVGTVVLIVVVYWSLRRIAAAARPISPALYRADTALRSRRTVFVMTTASAALGLQIAGLLAFTGSVLRGSHRDTVPTADTLATVETVAVEPGHTLALIAILASPIVAAASVALFGKGLAVITGLWSAGKASRRSDHAPAR